MPPIELAQKREVDYAQHQPALSKDELWRRLRTYTAHIERSDWIFSGPAHYFVSQELASAK